MAKRPEDGLPPSHSVPKGRLKAGNRKALLILAGLVFVALLIGVFLSGGRQEAEQNAWEGRPAPAQNQ